MVLERTLEIPLNCKEIQPVHSEGDQPWDFFGRTATEAEAAILGHMMQRADSLEKTLMLGKIEGRRRRARQRMRWFDGIIDGLEFEQALGDDGEQASLACFNPRGRKELDMTEQQ